MHFGHEIRTRLHPYQRGLSVLEREGFHLSRNEVSTPGKIKHNNRIYRDVNGDIFLICHLKVK